MNRAPGNENVILGGRMTGQAGEQPRLGKATANSPDISNDYSTTNNQTLNLQNNQTFNVDNSVDLAVLMPVIQQQVQSGSFAAIATVLGEIINALARLQNQADVYNTRITNQETLVEGFEKGQNVQTIRQIATGINRDRVALELVNVWLPYRGE